MKKKITPLEFSDIVLGADVETIRKALEARTEIDQLLEQREKAYAQIAELESQVEEVMGEEGSFPFPEPPAPVFGFGPAKAANKPKKKAPVSKPSVESQLEKGSPSAEAQKTPGTKSQDKPGDA